MCMDDWGGTDADEPGKRMPSLTEFFYAALGKKEAGNSQYPFGQAFRSCRADGCEPSRGALEKAAIVSIGKVNCFGCSAAVGE